MSGIKLIVSDLDGTLLSPDHRLRDDVLGAIRSFQLQGGYFTIATGRPLLTARRTIERLGIELPVILCNGAVIAVKGEPVESHGIDAGGLAGLLRDAAEAGVNVLQFRSDSIEVFRRTSAIEQFEHKEEIACRVVPLEKEVWAQGTLEKVILLGDIKTSLGVWERWRSRLGEMVAALQSESDYLELVSIRAGKGAALRKVAGMLGVKRHETMAIGNQMNDLSMLQEAGIGVAVANSAESLKQAADYICRASYGEGVAEAIKVWAFEEKRIFGQATTW